MTINETVSLEKIFKVLKEKNEEKHVFNNKEISEQEENIIDYKHLLDNLDKQIAIIESTKHNNDETINALLILRTKILDFIWHYEQLDNLLLKLLKQYDFKESNSHLY
jgi:hypothetical protein